MRKFTVFFDKLKSELNFKPKPETSCPKWDSKLINVKNSYELPENQKFEKLLECIKEEKLKLSTIIFYEFHTVL